MPHSGTSSPLGASVRVASRPMPNVNMAKAVTSVTKSRIRLNCRDSGVQIFSGLY